MRNYRNFDIWKNGITIAKISYDIVKLLPEDERYGLKSQISRSAVSIPSNIAEGCSRSSDKEFKRFLEIAIGSLFELETQITLCQELQLVPIQNCSKLEALLIKEAKMINSLIIKLKN